MHLVGLGQRSEFCLPVESRDANARHSTIRRDAFTTSEFSDPCFMKQMLNKPAVTNSLLLHPQIILIPAANGVLRSCT